MWGSGKAYPGLGKSIAQACSLELKCIHPSQQTHLWEGSGLPLAFLSHILFFPFHCRPLCIHTFVKYLNSCELKYWREEGKYHRVLVRATAGMLPPMCVSACVGVDVSEHPTG